MKRLLCVSGLIAGLTLSMSAMAFCSNDKPLLTITNNTTASATSTINNGLCSTTIGDIGITKPQSQSTLSECQVIAACILNESDCTAAVHLSNNCSGPVIGVVHLHASASNPQQSSISQVIMLDSHYNISYSGLNFTLSENTTSAAK